MSLVKNVKRTQQGGFDIPDFLFILFAAAIVCGCYLLGTFISASKLCGAGVAFLVGGALGMYLTVASASPEPEQQEEIVVDPQTQKALIVKKTA